VIAASALSTFNVITPVRLPRGRLRLLTGPSLTGSAPVRKTIGIVMVAAFAAIAALMLLPDAITLTPRRTRSAASAGSRSYRLSAQRYSIATFLFSNFAGDCP